MSKSMSRYPSLSVEGGGTGIVSHAGTALLLRAGRRPVCSMSCRGRWRRGANLWPSMTRARSCSIWRCRSRSVGTAWPTSRTCVGSGRVRAGGLRSDSVAVDHYVGC